MKRRVVSPFFSLLLLLLLVRTMRARQVDEVLLLAYTDTQRNSNAFPCLDLMDAAVLISEINSPPPRVRVRISNYALIARCSRR